MCPVLFKGSRSLLLLACCYVPIVRRVLIFKGGTWSSGNRAVIVVRVRHCLSVLVYAGLSMFTCCRALLVAGCTRLPMRITLHQVHKRKDFLVYQIESTAQIPIEPFCKS